MNRPASVVTADSRREGGQVLVIIILAMVGIFGFAALAVDGGRYFSERRRAQSAADAAAMAAAYAGATTLDEGEREANAQQAGIDSSRVNGYNDSDPEPAMNPNTPEDVRISYPPEQGRYSTASETINPEEYYQAVIRIQVPQVFSQIVFAGRLWVEVEAVARATPGQGFPAGAAVVATCPDCPDALAFDGSGSIDFIGNAISKSNRSGAGGNFSVSRANNVSLVFSGGYLIAGGAADNIPPGITPLSSLVTNRGDPNTYQYNYVPGCQGLPTYTAFEYTNSQELPPGIYLNGITATGSDTIITLDPEIPGQPGKIGMYCLRDDFRVSGGASIVGSNVMIFMESGSLDISGTGSVSLQAPTGVENCIEDPGYAPGCWSGFLVYMPFENNGYIRLGGGGSPRYSGTIYAPGPAAGGGVHKCSLEAGAAGAALDGSMICHTVKISGQNGVVITYEDNMNAQAPGSIELVE